MPTDYYCLGFMFSANLNNVLLIKKARPEWQAGKFNGLGGHIEKAFEETAHQAMAREFKEECGVVTTANDWTKIGRMFAMNPTGPMKWLVNILTMVGPIDTALSTTDERVQVVPITAIEAMAVNDQCVDNLSWLIEMCRYSLKTGRVNSVDIHYKS